MKNTPGSRHPPDALRTAFPLNARRLTDLAALVLAIVQARTIVLYTLRNHVSLPGTRDVRYQRYQRLLRFMQFTMPAGLYTTGVLRFLPVTSG
ncbi:hypothetical protein HNR42_002498 [Deinobacterium chartae]|uniref:Uncharacterized protein n=1 Tax=Deinobacterium chartae TaxID=521158 RepID=A0A841I537_9DEIO|nr:hypothetical protein [Deinobacterium chartae]